MEPLSLIISCFLMSQTVCQSLYSDCSESDDCGDHQYCDLAGLSQCRCEPGFHVNNMACTPALAEGAACTHHINCMLAHRSLRCLQGLCQCREDNRWNGTQCVSSPGQGVKGRQGATPEDRIIQPKVVRDDLSLILSNLMGPLGLILTILIIIGVCIIIHNHKTAEEENNRDTDEQIPTFTNSAFSMEDCESPPPPPPVTEGRSSCHGYSVQYQYRPSPTEDSSEEEFSILGEETKSGAQIKLEDSEEEEEITNNPTEMDRDNHEPRQNRDEGYRNCMKSVFKNIAEAQQSETKTEDISISFDESPAEGRPARETQYKVEAEPEEETGPDTPEKLTAGLDSAFTMSETELDRPGGFQPKLFLLLGAESVRQRVAWEVVRGNRNLQTLHIDSLVQKNISNETALGLEVKPIYTENPNLPDYLKSKLLLKELSSLVTGSSHIILDLTPFTVEEADHLQQIWPVSAAFLLKDCQADDFQGHLLGYYRDLNILQEVEPDDTQDLLSKINALII